ncbi:MAG: YIP1 family protein [Candidatus Eremiobacteraeota bacterium]|nr:YIP1 family protein [Candidatus Eremiobacteraeota bacterium]
MAVTPDAASAAPPEKANGLATYFKVIFAPGDAFATLARAPMWGWAALVGTVLTVVGTIVLMPATLHFIHATQEQSLSQMSADQAAAARATMAKIPNSVYSIFGVVGSIFAPWFYWLIGSIVFIIGAAISGAEVRFKAAWVGAVNCYVIPAIGTVIVAVIVMLRGPENVNSSADLYALPSLAMLVHGSPKLAGFLYAFNILNIWFYAVAVIAMEQLLKMSRGAAIMTVIVLALLGGGLAAIFAK